MKPLSLKMSVLMDTACVPSDLKMYLPLLLEVLTESPIMREGSRFSSIFFHIVFLCGVQVPNLYWLQTKRIINTY